MEMYNIYCDESCHLEHDGFNNGSVLYRAPNQTMSALAKK